MERVSPTLSCADVGGLDLRAVMVVALVTDVGASDWVASAVLAQGHGRRAVMRLLLCQVLLREVALL